MARMRLHQTHSESSEKWQKVGIFARCFESGLTVAPLVRVNVNVTVKIAVCRVFGNSIQGNLSVNLTLTHTSGGVLTAIVLILPGLVRRSKPP